MLCWAPRITVLSPPAGFTALVATSWYGHVVTQDFFDPFVPVNAKYASLTLLALLLPPPAALLGFQRGHIVHAMGGPGPISQSMILISLRPCRCSRGGGKMLHFAGDGAPSPPL